MILGQVQYKISADLVNRELRNTTFGGEKN